MNINYVKISELKKCENINNTIIPVSEIMAGNTYESKKISYSDLSSNLYSNVVTKFSDEIIQKVSELDKCLLYDTVSCMTGSVGYVLKNKVEGIELKATKKDATEKITGSWEFSIIPKTTQNAVSDNDIVNLKTLNKKISDIPDRCKFVKIGSNLKIVTSISNNGNHPAARDAGSYTCLCNLDIGKDYFKYNVGEDNFIKCKKAKEIIYVSQYDSFITFSAGNNVVYVYGECAECTTQNHNTYMIGTTYLSDKISHNISLYAAKGSIFYIYRASDIETDDDGMFYRNVGDKTFLYNTQITITEIPVY